MLPTVNILISTIGQRISQVPAVLMPQQEGVSYVISHQTDGSHTVPSSLTDRPDVLLSTVSGHGLSRNRNNTLRHANADICIIADDDCRYTRQRILQVRQAYADHPEADIICFASEGYNGHPKQQYPAVSMTYPKAVKAGYYISSVELTVRRRSVVGRICFNPHFGLGSPQLCAGEEDVFMADALRQGLTTLFIPQTIVQTAPGTTGQAFLTNPQLQLTKGATFRHCYGMAGALWRTLKEAGWWLIHRHANPFPILYRMIKGTMTVKQ